MNERRPWWMLPMLMWGVLGIAFLLRAPVTSVPPALSAVRTDLGLSAAQAGATTSLPLLCFGVFAFATPYLAAWLGLERTALLALVPITLGILLRSAGDVGPFFTGAVLVGSGIAVGNVLVPALVRARFAGQMALFMGLYTGMLQLSAALGSAATAPLQLGDGLGLGLGWRVALGVWVVPAAAAFLFWVVICARLRRAATPEAAPPRGYGHVVRRPLTWAVTVFMGLQSAVFYTLVTWLPAQLVDTGLSVGAAGVVVGLFSLLGLPGALMAPRWATSRRAGLAVLIVFGVQLIALVMLQLGVVAAVTGTLVAGCAQGAAFSMALTYIADQPDHRDVPALSALAQGLGYAVAATGPVLIGRLAESSGGWAVPNLTVGVVLVVLTVLGLGIGPRLHAAHLSAGR